MFSMHEHEARRSVLFWKQETDEEERRTVQRALQNNVGAANAVPKTPLQPANSADLGPATPRRIRHVPIMSTFHSNWELGALCIVFEMFDGISGHFGGVGVLQAVT